MREFSENNLQINLENKLKLQKQYQLHQFIPSVITHKKNVSKKQLYQQIVFFIKNFFFLKKTSVFTFF